MNLSEPKVITWWIAVILVVLGILATFVSLSFITTYAFWVVVLGFVVLLAGTLFKGL
jgi:threonine/homoserine/homoserine lactone efflux protein